MPRQQPGGIVLGEPQAGAGQPFPLRDPSPGPACHHRLDQALQRHQVAQLPWESPADRVGAALPSGNPTGRITTCPAGGGKATPGAAPYPGEQDDEVGIVPSADNQLKRRSEAIEVLQCRLDWEEHGLAKLHSSPDDDRVARWCVDHDMCEARRLTRQPRAERTYAKGNRREGKVGCECRPACR